MPCSLHSLALAFLLRMLVACLLYAGVQSGFGQRVVPASAEKFPRAVELLNRGVYFEAASLLEKYVAENPTHEAANLQFAKALYHLKRHNQAAHRAAEVLRINPDNREAKRLLTQLRITLGRELDATNPEAVLAYAKLCKHTDSYGRAGAFYERYLVFRPRDVAARLELARMLSWAGRFERSAHHYEQYVAEVGAEAVAEVHLEFARVLNSAGRFSEAAGYLEAALEVEPDRVDVLLDLARSYWWSGDRDGQIELYRRAVSVETESLEDLGFLVRIARKLNWTDSEYMLYERILALDPKDRAAAEGKSAYDDSEAIETLRLRKLVAGSPEEPALRRTLIKHFIRREQIGEAMGELKYLSKSDPIYIELRAEVEKLRRKVGGRTVALLKGMEAEVRERERDDIAACSAWLETHPLDLRTRSLLAYYLSAGQQPTDAAQQYRIILRTFPTVNPTISSRVKELEKQGAKSQ